MRTLRKITPLMLLAVFALTPSGSAVAHRADATARTEKAIVKCANSARARNGLKPLKTSGVLGKAARFQASNMAKEGFFAHTDPEGRDPGDRVEMFDPDHHFTFIGENIAAGRSSAAGSCEDWLHSEGHRENILRPQFTWIGGGFARGGPYGTYYVQVFGRRTQ